MPGVTSSDPELVTFDVQVGLLPVGEIVPDPNYRGNEANRCAVHLVVRARAVEKSALVELQQPAVNDLRFSGDPQEIPWTASGSIVGRGSAEMSTVVMVQGRQPVSIAGFLRATVDGTYVQGNIPGDVITIGTRNIGGTEWAGVIENTVTETQAVGKCLVL